MDAFRELGLSENSIKVLEKKGFTSPTAIQAKAIPLLLEGKKDVVGQSQTGTGKTASFALPILEKIKENSKTVQAIILTPTRELALQVAREINSLKGSKKIRVLPVYGGAPIGPQRDKLRDGVDIVVGTPGRVMDLQNRKSLRLDNIRYAVLDEADEMLNMGFVEDIESILKTAPKDKSMLLFSATMPKPILKIAKKYMREYEFIEVEKTQVVTDTVEQIYYALNAKDRVEALRRIFDYYLDFYGIVFCNTKATVDSVTQQLTKKNYSAAALHGDITQAQREKILQQFRDKHIKVLVATDVAARGIDVDNLTHVINFSLPQSPELYVHRIGRTGRAGKKGISVTFVIPSERRKLKFLEKINSCTLERRTLPSAKEIIKNKDKQIKIIIRNIIEANSGKSSKYNTMAEQLMDEHNCGEVIAAVLKYSFKNELELSSYKEISESKGEFSGTHPREGRNQSGRRDRSNRRSGRGSKGSSRLKEKSERSNPKRKSEKNSFDKYDKKSKKNDKPVKSKRPGKERHRDRPGYKKSDSKPGKREKMFNRHGSGRKKK